MRFGQFPPPPPPSEFCTTVRVDCILTNAARWSSPQFRGGRKTDGAVRRVLKLDQNLRVQLCPFSELRVRGECCEIATCVFSRPGRGLVRFLPPSLRVSCTSRRFGSECDERAFDRRGDDSGRGAEEPERAAAFPRPTIGYAGSLSLARSLGRRADADLTTRQRSRSRSSSSF